MNTNVNKNLAITHIQNVNALTSVTKINNATVTGLASLNPGAAGGKKVANYVLKVETMPKEQHAEAVKAIAQSHDAGLHRHEAEAKILAGGAAPIKATDPPKAVKIELPKTTPLPPNGLKSPPLAPPPPPPKLPMHVEKPIPPHEPPKPATPPPPPSDAVTAQDPPPA